MSLVGQELVAEAERKLRALFGALRRREEALPRNYVTQLILERLFSLGDKYPAEGYGEWAWGVVRGWGRELGERVPWRHEPFGSFTFALYRRTGSEEARRAFVEESRAMYAERPLSPEGAVLHMHRGEPGRLLIDRLQAYAIRCAQLGRLTREGELFEEAVEQTERYRNLLRDPRTGLWSQGRGWAGPPEDMLSPGAWSRGHGWVMQGMAGSLEYLPNDGSHAQRMSAMLNELGYTLLSLQDGDGFWHALLDQPWEDSSVETSGTGLIAGWMARGVKGGWLPESAFAGAVERGVRALLTRIEMDGTLRDACPGPGPLYSILNYYRTEFEANELHGVYGALVAMDETLG